MSADIAAASSEEKSHFRWKRFVIFTLVLVVIGAAADLLGWDIKGWFNDLWDTMTEISVGSLIAAVVLQSIQTTATAFAWYSILAFAYSPSAVRWRQILACYAASVALNGILPANLGTVMLLLMLTTIIAAATFAGTLGGYAVQKIFFTAIGAFVYLYLFLSVGGSFDIKFSFVHSNPWATAIVIVGGALLIYLLVRWLWPRILRWWGQAKEGGRILANPRAYFGRVFLPSLIGWCAMVSVIGVFLAAYEIPVTFHTLMSVVGGNSLANVTSVTPGGAGVNQAFNVASLRDVTSATNATAFSVSRQLVITAWNIVFAIALLVLAFGWSGGKELVSGSYVEAKEKVAERKAAKRRGAAEHA
jgi:uncharacterized membrane protein YbhN (UPF0104 family)